MRRPVRSAPAPLPSVGGTPRRDSLGAGGCPRFLRDPGVAGAADPASQPLVHGTRKVDTNGIREVDTFRDRVPGWRGPRGLRHGDGGGVPHDPGAPPEGGMAEAGPGDASRGVPGGGRDGLGPEEAERSERPPNPGATGKARCRTSTRRGSAAGSDGGNPLRPVSVRRERSSPVLVSNKAGAGVAGDLRRGRGADHGGPGPVRAAARFRVAALPPNDLLRHASGERDEPSGSPETRRAGRARRRAPPSALRWSPSRLPAYCLPLPPPLDPHPCRGRPPGAWNRSRQRRGRSPFRGSRSGAADPMRGLRGVDRARGGRNRTPRRRGARRTVLFRGRREDARGSGRGSLGRRGEGRGATLQVIR